MKIVIIKYFAGNVKSIYNSLLNLGIKADITNNIEKIIISDKVIIPGVGEASTAMFNLKKKKLDKIIVNLKQPVLGICLGMHLLCKYSEENKTKCLNIFKDVKVIKLLSNKKFKVPHIGWNNIFNFKKKIFNNIPNNSYQYFVHSYYVPINKYSIACVNYINNYSSAICRDNFYGVQFHPEKSSIIGRNIINNFLKLK